VVMTLIKRDELGIKGNQKKQSSNQKKLKRERNPMPSNVLLKDLTHRLSGYRTNLCVGAGKSFKMVN